MRQTDEDAMNSPPDLTHVPDLVDADVPQIPVRDENLWVFGYGSLMWNPGFRYTEQQPATIFGAHRALCVWSIRYRGTPESPGLVLGLRHGGRCTGRAFRVEKTDRLAAIEYLRKRELNTGVYRPVYRRIHIDGRGVVDALTFLVIATHPQYAANLNERPKWEQPRLRAKHHSPFG
jgi:cation transport protein ChaC